jgi:hypothetical protein
VVAPLTTPKAAQPGRSRPRTRAAASVRRLGLEHWPRGPAPCGLADRLSELGRASRSKKPANHRDPQGGIQPLTWIFKWLRPSWILDGYTWIQVFLNLFIEIRTARIHLFILPYALATGLHP